MKWVILISNATESEEETVIGRDSLIKGWNLTLDFKDIEFVYEKAKIFKVIKRRIKDSSSYIGAKFKPKIKNTLVFFIQGKKTELEVYKEILAKFSSLVISNIQ